ncbi:MAE_28990/MAE_18760 family HEPN-like nuclease [Stenotrophomonas sp. TWI377]|uniref:MAE_28990/MAE_18760 family HEPN-like nuclease n=1 Tax=Stenotrophomonas sp. TWI377 TaxID=3136775 RepID=UPI003209E645
MTRPRTPELLGEVLNSDRVWRIRELSDLKAAIRRSDGIGRRVLLRALVTIAYAHWEGYVRLAAKNYLEFVATQTLRYAELHPQFLKNYFIPRLASLYGSKKNFGDSCRIVEEVLSGSALQFSKVDEGLVSTRSNLSSSVMSDICMVCGVDSSPYESQSAFIDKLLLDRRNAIAHGENAFIDDGQIDEIVDTTVTLMRSFGDQLENAAATASYRLA